MVHVNRYMCVCVYLCMLKVGAYMYLARAVSALAATISSWGSFMASIILTPYMRG